MDYRGQRATIMGLGHFGGGVAAARWLAQQGAHVTVTDSANETALADSLPLLADTNLAALHLGGHREEDFRNADLIVVNPAVRPGSPWHQFARQTDAQLCTELELFMENCPARMIGVTGSNGKSTTAAMIASILNYGAGVSPAYRNAGETPAPQETKCHGSKVFLGGNIGGSLLPQLPQIDRNDWVVLEISSFQLWHFTPTARMPHIAVVTGCSPNHLDWHDTFPEYVAAKQRLLTGQTPADFAVLNTFDTEVSTWSRLVRGRQMTLGGANIPVCPMLDNGGADIPVCPMSSKNVRPAISLDTLPPLPVPGLHNRINAACAAAAATAAGCERKDIRRGLEQFHALPQRLEWFATVDGRRFYNDSTATTPESTVAALQSLDGPIWLLAGGKSKGFDFGPLAAEIAHRAQGAAFFGAAKDELRLRTTTMQPAFACTAVETMEEALRWCWPRSRPGDAVVLSPACASTDQFRNFRERGEQFVALIERLASPRNR